jgi:hypothetical protein
MPDSTKTTGGRAILVAVETDGSAASWDVFVEGECGEHDGEPIDPIRAAEALRDSCEADFPTRMWTIATNERARELMAARRMRQWGMVDA